MGIFDKKYRNKKQFLKGILPAMPIIVIGLITIIIGILVIIYLMK